jgi:hypothetical protein
MNEVRRGRFIRLPLLLAIAFCGALLLPGGASAAETEGTSFKKVPITGKAANGQKFVGSYTIDRFAKKGSKVVAIGKLTGKLGGKKVSKPGVAMPVRTQGATKGAGASATCEILDLVLGPLDLNLLGLRVQLNKVHLRITAISGPGNLLGNLLCAVVNLLNQSPLPLNQVSGLLNIVLQLVNNPSLGTLPAPVGLPLKQTG